MGDTKKYYLTELGVNIGQSCICVCFTDKRLAFNDCECEILSNNGSIVDGFNVLKVTPINNNCCVSCVYANTNFGNKVGIAVIL